MFQLKLFSVSPSMNGKASLNLLLVSIWLHALVLFPQVSFSQSTDSIAIKKIWYKTKAFKTTAVPTVLMTTGFATMGDQSLLYSSRTAQKRITNQFTGFHTSVDDFAVFTPLAAVYGLNFTGVKGKHNLVDLSILYSLSIVATTSATLSLKEFTRVLRPDSSNFHSFPSGHTSLVFTMAEIMNQEYKEKSAWYSVAGYGMAITTGALRMLNNRHWLSDVLVGAGLGMVITKVTYLYYPWFQRKVLKNKTKGFGFMPFYLNGGGGGVSLVYVR